MNYQSALPHDYDRPSDISAISLIPLIKVNCYGKQYMTIFLLIKYPQLLLTLVKWDTQELVYMLMYMYFV